MRIMIMSDVHFERDFHRRVWEGGAKDWVVEKITEHDMTDLVLCGDSGYGWNKTDWDAILERVRIHAIYGNHDNVKMMKTLRNLDNTRVLAEDGEVRTIGGLKFGFINGILAYSRKAMMKNQMFYEDKKAMTETGWVPRKTPEEYLTAAAKLTNKIDVLVTHASVPMPDETRFHQSEEFQIVTEAVKISKPRIHFSGHLSGPYKVGDLSGARFVRVDSSPKEKHYAVLSDDINIYSDTGLVETSKYV